MVTSRLVPAEGIANPARGNGKTSKGMWLQTLVGGKPRAGAALPAAASQDTAVPSTGG